MTPGHFEHQAQAHGRGGMFAGAESHRGGNAEHLAVGPGETQRFQFSLAAGDEEPSTYGQRATRSRGRRRLPALRFDFTNLPAEPRRQFLCLSRRIAIDLQSLGPLVCRRDHRQTLRIDHGEQLFGPGVELHGRDAFSPAMHGG